MLEGRLVVASLPRYFAMCIFQNRSYDTSSKYKLATTNHHGHDFSIGKLATASFHSNIIMWVMLEGNAYAKREASIRSK